MSEVQPALLDLESATVLGEGYHRICYLHPNDDAKCVKVAKDPSDETDNTIDAIYAAHLERRDVPFDFLPRCFGWTETSRGRGLVFERIRNADGSAAESFRSHLADGRLDLAAAKPMLEKLRQYLVEHAVIMADVGLTNLLVQQRPDGQVLYLIDGLGSRNLDLKFVLHRAFPFLGRSRTKRKWRVLLTDTGKYMKVHELPTGLPAGEDWAELFKSRGRT